MLACGSTTTSAIATTPAIAASTDTCPNAGGLVLEVPTTIAGHWSGGMTTGGSVSATVRWCGPGVVSIDRFVMTRGGSLLTEWAFDPAATHLAHGERFSHDVAGPAEPQELELTAFAHDDAGHEIRASANVRSVPDPRFVEARAACVARGGTFAPAGLAGAYACDAPTRDAGRRCLASAECESSCVETHTEVTTSPPDHRACAAGEEVRLHVGACSARSLHFGCSALLIDVTTECLQPGQSARSHVVCVD